MGGYNITATGTVTNTIIISGTNNTITAGLQTAGSTTDGIFKIVGGDYISIQNFTMQENAGNTVTAVGATNTMTEWGVGLFYANTTDGAQNNTIQNNTISLNRAYFNSFAIYSNTRHTATAPNSGAADITLATGSNSNNKVYGNTISNVAAPICFVGSANDAGMDTGNDIGGTSALTGNTLTNWGANTAPSSGISVAIFGTVFGILVNQQKGYNIQYNSLTSASLIPIFNLRGIFSAYSLTNPTGTFSNTISNNTVTLTSTSLSAPVVGIISENMNIGLATATVNINSNTIRNCSVARDFTGITSQNSAGTVNLNNNIIRSNTLSSTTNTYTGILNTGAVQTALAINNNQLGNASGGFVTYSVANSGNLTGLRSSGTLAANATVSISGNDIRGITHSVNGSSSHTYINLTGATDVGNIATIENNTFTNLNIASSGITEFINHSYSMSSTGQCIINNNSIVTAFNKSVTGTVTLTATSGASSVNGSIAQYTNNNFSNITLIGASTLIGFNNSDGGGGSPTKTITGNTFNNWITGTANITCMNFISWSGALASLSNNTLTNITGQSSITGIDIGSNGNLATVLNVANNTINNLSSTGIGVTGINCSNTSTTININNNTINTLSSPAFVFGMNVLNASTTNIFKNKIYDLSSSNTNPAVFGIMISGGATVNTHNNVIGDLRTPAANAANPLIGINIAAGTTSNVYYNTVYLNGSSSGALFGSSAISVASTPTVTLRNNIFVNNSTTTGAGLAVAYRRSGTTLTSYGASSNNNLFYAGTPSATNLIFSDGTNSDQTLASYKTRVSSRDVFSVTENPTFQSTVGSNANFLKPSISVPTQIENAAVTIATFTDDYANNTRNVTTPDMGAYEDNYIFVDLAAPTITYTPLLSNCSIGARTLTATIIDNISVPTSGAGLPVLYWKINAGAYTASQGTFVSGNTYTFSLGAGSVVGDVISYYIIAQDLAATPNVGAFPSAGAAGFTATPPAASTAPTTPSSYIVSLAGTYNVGIGQTYTTLTAAVAAYNASCLSGAVVFSLTDANYPSETFPITINANTSVNATNTLTIKPTQAATTITGSSASALLVLNGADYIIVDGSIGSTVNAICPLATASRDLTFTNTNTGTSSAVVWLRTTTITDAATNNIVRNCNLVGSGVTQTLFGVGSGSATISTTSLGTSNNNNAFINNNISAVQYGIYSQGASAAAKNTGTIINQNLINTSVNTRGGIWVGFENNITISGNTISNIARVSGGSSIFAISCGFGVGYTVTTTTGNEVTNATITHNNIGSVVNSATTSAVGIGVSAATSGTTLIANNTISGVMANSTSGRFAGGIVLGGGTGAVTNVYYNTVVMQGTIIGTAAATQASFCFATTNTTAFVAIRNNNFVNTQIGNTGATLKFITIAISNIGGGGNTDLSSNNNNLFCAGAGPGNYFIGTTNGIVPGFDRTTIADWRTFALRDAASLNISPVFVSSTDLHLVAANATNTPLATGGTPLSVTNDIDCTTRSVTTPSIGADEFVPPPPTTIYVNASTGNDANDGLSNALPKLTLQGAFTTVGDGNTVVLNAGTYNETATLTGKSITLQSVGNPTVQTVIMNGVGKTITLSGNINISQMLDVQAGDLAAGGNLTLLSTVTDQAMLIQSASTNVTGNVNVQRYLRSNTGTSSSGYRFVSSPTSDATLNQISELSPVVNPAFNTSATPGKVAPFPTVYAYDATKAGDASKTFTSSPFPEFDKGWVSPSALTDAMTAGKGFTVNTAANQKVEITGTVNNGNVNIPIVTGNAASLGYNLIGNPYPSPIKWSLVRALSSGVNDAIYQNMATGQYTGSWASYVNGMGVNGASDDIAVMQGFFVIANAGGNVVMNNTVRATTYTNPSSFRTEDDKTTDKNGNKNNGLLRLAMTNSANKTDETVIYFNDKASANFDKEYDALKFQLNGGNLPNIYTTDNKTEKNTLFSINALPTLRDDVTVPIVVQAWTAGKQKIAMTEKLNFNRPVEVYLKDKTTNTLHNFSNGAFEFNASAGIIANRFEIIFKPQFTAAELGGDNLNLYPNPSSETVNISIGDDYKGELILKLTDVSGREVWTAKAEKTGKIYENSVNVENLASGTYILEVSGAKRMVKKVVKQ